MDRMKGDRARRGFWVLGALICFALIAGCVVVEPANRPPPRRGPAYVPPPSPKRQGPPPHAKAHGRRARHIYRYYPTVGVYFDLRRRVYFYQSGGRWRVAAHLPGRFRVDLGQSVRLELDVDQPYVYYDEHRRKYPPGKYKKGRKKKEKYEEWGR